MVRQAGRIRSSVRHFNIAKPALSLVMSRSNDSTSSAPTSLFKATLYLTTRSLSRASIPSNHCRDRTAVHTNQRHHRKLLAQAYSWNLTEGMSYYSSTSGASGSGTYRYNPCGLEYYLLASVLTVPNRFQGKTTNDSPAGSTRTGHSVIMMRGSNGKDID